MGIKNSKLYAMVAMTCPRCHEGHLFKTHSAYKKGMAEMNKKCPNCGENFTREPGFYYGAAYVSYALTVALWVAVFVAMATFDALGLMSFSFFDDAVLFLVAGVTTLLLLMPVLYRLSRSLWIHIFVSYQENAIEFNQNKKREKEARVKETIEQKEQGY